MLLVLFNLFIVFLSTPASASNLTHTETPSAFYQQNAKARYSFIAKVKQSQEIDDETKNALVALVSPNEKLSGDSVHERLDEDLLRWFYGKTDANKDDNLVHKTRLLKTKEDLKRCKRKKLCVYISKRQQHLTVFENGKPTSGLVKQKVSTARSEHYTPTGTFSVGEIGTADRVSNLYDGAALYYAMQIDGNIFIHATSKNNYKHLGQPASAGCIRTTFTVAQQLNRLMRKYASTSFSIFTGHHDRPSIRVVVTEG